jgi:hypothetical protein
MAKRANDYETVLKDGVFTLSKPYKHDDGPEHTVLDFPLKSMTGQHIRTAQRNYEMVEGQLTGMAELNKSYLAYVAAALMKVQPDFVFDLPITDFTNITLFVQRFLFGLD